MNIVRGIFFLTPTAEPLIIRGLITKAGLDGSNIPEIIDIVGVLIEFGVIESAEGHNFM